jgi:type I protein arginine methyltransferase
VRPDVSSKSLFDDDVYLKPVIEDDTLLYSLEDLEDGHEEVSAEKRVIELQEELGQLQGQFEEYRLAVQRSMNTRLLLDDEKLAPSGVAARTGPTEDVSNRAQDPELDYFTSYSYNGAFDGYRQLFILVDYPGNSHP